MRVFHCSFQQISDDAFKTRFVQAGGSRAVGQNYQRTVIDSRTLFGVVILWAVVATQGTALGPWALVAPVFVVGLGMGTCFGTLFDIAVGDIDPGEAGSASGSLSAVQQLAGSIGSAAIMSIWFAHRASGGAGAVVACLIVVAALTLGCCALVGLLPRAAPAREEPTPLLISTQMPPLSMMTLWRSPPCPRDSHQHPWDRLRGSQGLSSLTGPAPR